MPPSKETKDLRAAFANASQGEDGRTVLSLIALRVDGMPAESIAEPVLEMIGAGELDVLPPEFSLTWEDIDVRSVLVAAYADDSSWLSVYPKGEVAFIGLTTIPEPDVTIEDVLAELP